MPKSATIITDARIRTMDSSLPTADAISFTADGRISAVGTELEVRAACGNAAATIHLGGRTIVPGFFDCHMHILWLGSNLCQVDLSCPPVESADDIVRLLTARLAAKPGSLCIRGNRYDQNKLNDRTHLSRHDLDRVSSVVPVRIEHTSGHAAVVNSAALSLLEIRPETPNPAGGEIVRDAGGIPTGLLLESAAWINVERIIPEATHAENMEALRIANHYLVERGITSAGDARTVQSEISTYRNAVLSNTLQVRTNLMADWAEIMARSSIPPRPDDLQPHDVSWHRLHVGQAKLFADGAITTRTCWLTEPFCDMPDNFGIPLHSPDELRSLIAAAHDAGWQIATHAIGDCAVDEVLKCYAEAQRLRARRKPGHRIEHCMLLNSDLIARLRRQNVWSIGQPEFIYALGDAYVTGLGPERASRLSPYACLEQNGVAQAFSSDCPVVPGSPLAGIRAAVERRTRSGAVLNQSERVSIDTALYAYTAAPAYATFTSRDRGTLEIGKLADMTVLSADPLCQTGVDWDALRVDATFINGECVFGSEILE